MRRSRAAAAAILAAFYLPLLPEIAGRRLLAFRDAFITHFPIKTWSAAALATGHVPFLNPGASNVEPLLSDPNTFCLYPTNVLYSFLPAATAFNLHLLLHVAVAFLGAAALARRLGARRAACLAGGAAYAFSGPYLSYAAAFSNAAAAAAWAPWVVSEVLRLSQALAREDHRQARRAALGAGIALGLQVLAGEPAISAWTILLAGLIAAGRGWRRPVSLLLHAGLAGALGCLLAAPQILSTAAAIPLSFRGEHLFSRAQFGAAANVPWRLAESFFPLVFGSPRPMVSGAFWAYRWFDSLQPYLYSTSVGLATIVLVGSAFWIPTFRRSRKVLGLAVLALLFLLLSFGFRTPLFEALYAVAPLRHFRYPVKFLLPFVLCWSALTALAVGAWTTAAERRTLKWAAASAAGALALGAATTVVWPAGLMRLLEPQFRNMAFGPGAVLPGIFRIVRADAALGIFAMFLLVAAARRAPARLLPALLVLAVLLCLLPGGWPLFVSVPSAAYEREPDLARATAGRGRLYCNVAPDFLVARNGARHRFGNDDIGEVIQAGRREIWPLTALPEGVTYAFDADPDGSYGFLDRVMSEATAAAPVAVRARLLRAASVRFWLSDSAEVPPGFHRLARQEVAGRRLFLFEVDAPLALIRAATRVHTRASLSASVALMKREDFDASRDVVLEGPDRDTGGDGAPSSPTAERVGSESLAATFSCPNGCVAVFAVTCFHYWRATLDGRPAPVEIANANFSGVRVPPGTHRVTLFYDEAPFRRGAAGSGLFAVAAAVILRRSRRQLSPRAPEA